MPTFSELPTNWWPAGTLTWLGSSPLKSTPIFYDSIYNICHSAENYTLWLLLSVHVSNRKSKNCLDWWLKNQWRNRRGLIGLLLLEINTSIELSDQLTMNHKVKRGFLWNIQTHRKYTARKHMSSMIQWCVKTNWELMVGPHHPLSCRCLGIQKLSPNRDANKIHTIIIIFGCIEWKAWWDPGWGGLGLGGWSCHLSGACIFWGCVSFLILNSRVAWGV